MEQVQRARFLVHQTSTWELPELLALSAWRKCLSSQDLQTPFHDGETYFSVAHSSETSSKGELLGADRWELCVGKMGTPLFRWIAARRT
eukprot:1480659-Amphidinium_carterae.1